MTTPQGMEIFATRLASFDTAQPTTKRKRASGAKGTRTLKWPHKSPSPTRLARAGFFYAPTASCPDNAICFMCAKGLDGWEEEDDPVKEHLNYSPECGWAITMAIEQEVENGLHENEDSMSTKMLEARKSTFSDRWPHENKRGWTCKVQKMIEAGWYHSPTAESDDLVKCAYCSLSLDGWEPKDKPFEEHQRRSPECAFFEVSQHKNVKPPRAKKGRPSKASQISTQSNIAATLEDLSMLEAGVGEGESIASAATHMTAPTTVSKVVKRLGEVQKGQEKAQNKAVGALTTEDLAQNSIFVEPEDDNFEVKVDTDSSERHQRKKRSNSMMEAEDPPLEEYAKPTKRQATRTRNSAVKPEIVPDHAEPLKTANDTEMADNEDIALPALPTSKRVIRPGRKRGFSATRKTSNLSTASKAPLRGVPTDIEIDAALEADLNEPLTDNEAEHEVCTGLKTRRLTRSRPDSMQGSGSIAPARVITQFSTVSAEDVQTEVRVEILKSSEFDAAVGTIDKNLQPTSAPKEEFSTIVKSKPRKAKSQVKFSMAPEALGKQDSASIDQDYLVVDQPSAIKTIEVAPDKNQTIESDTRIVIKSPEISIKNRSAACQGSKKSKSRRSTPHVSGRGKAGSVLSVVDTASESQLNMDISVLNTKAVADELTRESHTKPMTEALSKPAGKKGKSFKKGKLLKRMDGSSQQVKDIVQTSAQGLGEDHSLRSNIQSKPEEGKAGTRVSISLASTTNFEEGPMVRGGSAEGSKPAEKAEAVPKLKVDKGRPKGKISLSSPRIMHKQNEPTPEFQTLPSQEHSTTSVNAVESTASSPKTLATFTPTLQPSTPKPAVPSPTLSPQSSDAENQPPSSRPSQQRPPLFETSPSRLQIKHIPLVAITPNTSPTRQNITSRVQTTFSWKAIDVENIFLHSPQAAQGLPQMSLDGLGNCLPSAEMKMTVEEWVQFNAAKGEKDLRNECERLVGRFEVEGNRALRALEGIICKE